MNYKYLVDILLSDDVYNTLKQNEKILFKLIPELKLCNGFEQNNQWNIYDVYEHILHVISGTKPNIYLRLAALFHDIGKPISYTEDNNGVGHFYNHWLESIAIYKKYQNKFGLTNDENNLVINLIFYHDINIPKMNNEEISKLIEMIGKENISLLFDLKRADLLAQAPKYHILLKDIENQEQRIKK